MSYKTLIGKNNYLFLINDSAKELEVHCNNLNLVNDKQFNRYKFDNFLLVVIPNKSLVYKKFLPDDYIVKYRPALNDYKTFFGNKILDTYDALKNEENTYYKTDTHINMKGNYVVYKQFIQKINELYNLNVKIVDISFKCKECILSNLNIGIGDLLWKNNLGEQIVNEENKMDLFYYSDDITYLYYKHKINDDDQLRILDKDFVDQNIKLQNSLLSWEILSEYILYKKNNTDDNLKVIIFYDSFLISFLDIYLKLFKEVYMIKEIYNPKYIDALKPDYVFEFRVERFLF
jgi:hypothetical protein